MILTKQAQHLASLLHLVKHTPIAMPTTPMYIAIAPKRKVIDDAIFPSVYPLSSVAITCISFPMRPPKMNKMMPGAYIDVRKPGTYNQ